jgi:hypothetical protein
MKTTTVRIPDDVQEALTLSAGRNYRSLHGEIIVALRHYAKRCALSECEATHEEVARIFDNGPDYEKLAKKRKEELKEKDELITTMGRVVTKLEEVVKEFDPEYFERQFAKDREEEEAAEETSEDLITVA